MSDITKHRTILITGASGFIGQLVAERLLNEFPNYSLTLTDIVEPTVPRNVRYPHNAKTIKADLCEPSACARLVSAQLDAVYVFHGIMSSGAEADFDLGMRVNFDSTRQLLESLRAVQQQTSTSPSSSSSSSSSPPSTTSSSSAPGGERRGRAVRVIYASSQAVYGQPLPAVVHEGVMPTPEGSYGIEKMLCEHLLNEYHRRGFVEALALRFPTVCVRPGRPTAAASSFLSGMIREPLRGLPCRIPLRDRAFRSSLCSPRTLCDNLVRALDVPAGALPPHLRHVCMPGITVSVQQMMDALERVAGKEALELLSEETDPVVERILRSWGTTFDNSKAYSLGFKGDESFDQAVIDFKESLQNS